MASNPKKKNQTQVIRLYSALLSRAELAAKLGYQYGGDRDVYEALGYKTTLEYSDYATQYERQDIAKAVIDRPVDATWRGGFTLLESDDDKDTPLEKAFREMYDKLALRSKFMRLDRLAGIGDYGVLLLGLSDVKNSWEFQNPVKGGSLNLVYVKPFGEGNAYISEYEKDPGNERYGMPLFYDLSITNPSTTTSSTLRVHYSRVIHVASGLLESEVEGTPRLMAVYNRLQDLEKIVGASAEMFWRGARPGYQGKVDPEYTLTTEMKDDLQDEMDEFEHNLRRYLLNEGITWETLAPQVADPSAHVDVQIQMISAVTGIPKRILTGSERGELASTEDKSSWFELIEGRREEFAEVQIVRPFVDLCIEYGALPPVGKDGYTIVWPDLWALGDKEKAEIGKIRASALKDYATMPTAESLVPPEAFLEYFLGLEKEQIELIREFKEAEVAEEGRDMEGAEEEEEEPEEPEEERVTLHYDPDQPRAPKGTEEGGQWVDDGRPESEDENFITGIYVDYLGRSFSIFKNPSRDNFLTIIKESKEELKDKGWITELNQYEKNKKLPTRFIKIGKNIYIFSDQVIHPKAFNALVAAREIKRNADLTKASAGFGVIDYGKKKIKHEILHEVDWKETYNLVLQDSLLEIHYNPDPCHKPAGTPEGGQFTSCPGGRN